MEPPHNILTLWPFLGPGDPLRNVARAWPVRVSDGGFTITIPTQGSCVLGGTLHLPSGYVKIAIENGHL